MSNRCVSCGEIIPEGRQVCWACENGKGEKDMIFKKKDEEETRLNMGTYAERIVGIMKRQHEKGVRKYGETLEDNTTLSRVQRIEHIEEEMIDGLQYCEHLKEVVNDGLTADDYQRMAMRTANGMTDDQSPVADFLCRLLPECDASYIRKQVKDNQDFFELLNGVMGLCGEAGECIDIMKKTLFQGHAFDHEHFREELGDVQWYVADAADGNGDKLSEVMQGNVDKLMKRYPEGFDKARSINRKG